MQQFSSSPLLWCCNDDVDDDDDDDEDDDDDDNDDDDGDDKDNTCGVGGKVGGEQALKMVISSVFLTLFTLHYIFVITIIREGIHIKKSLTFGHCPN